MLIASKFLWDSESQVCYRTANTYISALNYSWRCQPVWSDNRFLAERFLHVSRYICATWGSSITVGMIFRVMFETYDVSNVQLCLWATCQRRHKCIYYSLVIMGSVLFSFDNLFLVGNVVVHVAHTWLNTKLRFNKLPGEHSVPAVKQALLCFTLFVIVGPVGLCKPVCLKTSIWMTHDTGWQHVHLGFILICSF